MNPGQACMVLHRNQPSQVSRCYDKCARQKAGATVRVLDKKQACVIFHTSLWPLPAHNVKSMSY